VIVAMLRALGERAAASVGALSMAEAGATGAREDQPVRTRTSDWRRLSPSSTWAKVLQSFLHSRFGDAMSERTKDDLETTRVSNLDQLRAELKKRSERDRAYLIVLAGADVGKMFKVGEGETTLGRSHRADVRIDDDSISRLHAKVMLVGN
jgi:hypothetical protein